MPLLIDGFNLIYKFPELEELMYRGKLNDARKGLINILREYQHIKKSHIRIVFDGKKKPSDPTRSEKSGPMELFYSQDYSADHLIKEFIKKDPNPKMTTVITSDKEIIFYVNRFRAQVQKSEDFAVIIKKTIEEYRTNHIPEKEEDPLLSEEEISFWEKMFKKK